MARRQRFAIKYSDEIKRHMALIDSKFYSLIREKIEEQLSYEPNVETKNRKRLDKPLVANADWEIRFGPGNRFRVFYQVNTEGLEVHLAAIGEKDRNRLIIGGEELQ